MKKFIPLVMVAFLVGACGDRGGQKQTAGTLLGAGLGALAGSQIGSGRGQLVALGALGGAFLGSESASRWTWPTARHWAARRNARSNPVLRGRR